LARRGTTPLQLEGRRALVMGLGTRQGGVGVTRYLVREGAHVTVTDLRTEGDLRPALASLEGLPVRYHLGEHRDDDFDNAEIVVRNPGVPRTSPWLQRARGRGAAIEMEMSLFFRACPAPIIGITGTKGKTTTATLLAAILRRMRSDTVLAGNMGTSALDQLELIGTDTPVVLELSSWQLEGLADYQMSPDIAVLTNISEDHLNRYDSMQDYVEAKRHITRFQGPEDWFLVNRNDSRCWDMHATTSARVVPFGRLSESEDGASVVDGALIWRWGGVAEHIMDVTRLPMRGEHVLSNALASSAAAIIAGATTEHVRDALSKAEPVPHRQELVETINGVDFVNDTTATAPAAAIAALRTYSVRPVVLIAGGAGKGASLQEFAELASRQAIGVVLLDGDETPNLRDLLQQCGAKQVSDPQPSMSAAVRRATEWSRPGGVVLLSPACASFGMFRDEFDRGEQFRQVVRELARATTGGTRE
jgi:UDP-N-acetylmuramoylalanine--D-glutamate ligase